MTDEVSDLCSKIMRQINKDQTDAQDKSESQIPEVQDQKFKYDPEKWREDPFIYGKELGLLRITIKEQNGSIACLKCKTVVRVDLKSIEQQVRHNKILAQTIPSKTALFAPPVNGPRVCKKCKGVFCSACVQDASDHKRYDGKEIKALLFEYFPPLIYASEVEKDRAFQIGMSDESMLLCQICKKALLGGIDHITD